MGLRPDLPPFPNGWYVFGLSRELAAGKLLARKFMGQDVVVFRTVSGRAYAVDAYCPHLGAHFGYGGTVRGEVIQCPFHGFQYDGSGACVKTGYDSPVPPAARLKTWPLREHSGFLLIYHHARGEPPAWEVPPVETAGWTPLICHTYTLADHPQETTENSVDAGHFTYVHHYRDVRTLKEFEADGPHLSTAYAVKRALRPLGLPLAELNFSFETQIYGLGYSMVNVTVPALRLTARLWVLPTAIDAERLTLRLAVRARKPASPLGGVLAPLMARFMLSGLSRDAGQDFPIWEHKRYTQPPALARGDGPIGRYRQWAKQFYL